MPMDKPNFALFPRFLSLAPPKLWDLRPIRGNQEHKYSAHKGASLTYSGRLSNEGPLPPHLPFKLRCSQIFTQKEVSIQKPIVSAAVSCKLAALSNSPRTLKSYWYALLEGEHETTTDVRDEPPKWAVLSRAPDIKCTL